MDKLPLYYINRSKNIFVSNLDTNLENNVTDRVFSLIKEPSFAYLFQCWDSTQNVLRYVKTYNLLKKHAHIEVTVLCNTQEDVKTLTEIGFNCLFVHHNAFLDEYTFTIQKQTKKYNAIYTAQILPYKRIELAACVKNLGLITFVNSETCQYPEYVNFIASKKIGKILNPYRQIMPKEVANFISQAKCGLILSKEEGGNYATTEYLLCGVPVISTQNIGGRNIFLNEKNSIFVNDSSFEIGNIVNNFNNLLYNPQSIRDNCLNVMYENRNRFYEHLEDKFGEDWDSEYKFVNKLIQWV